MAKFLPY